ncbi:hypothetical protein [Flavobacterium sp. 3HN19-14]|uniref:hypothetical protein n=1 Tax=Flavobacterium sp. 3HN19-14 TaxID=3448133 RepID=UPI003EE16D9B
MKIKLLTLFGILLLVSCVGENDAPDALPIETNNKVLLLKVDYLTNEFEGGKELAFADSTATFTLSTNYVAPSDFGSIKIKYDELDTEIFNGSIVWNGLGTISNPDDMQPASAFTFTDTDDFFTCAGFDNIFNPNNEEFDYQPVWSSVQGLVKVRQYLTANPGAGIKLFLYTPSVGIGNPAEWDWIIILKN